MQVSGLLPRDDAEAWAAELSAEASQSNSFSENLAHTQIAGAEALNDGGRFAELTKRLAPLMVRFGEELLGETLEWRIKELWANVLDKGGRQAIHNHANSMISAIIYLTEVHDSARTQFHRAVGSTEFVLSNDNPRAKQGPYNGRKWLGPPPQPGDAVLYPSYLLHEVPENLGERRVTIAVNAIPTRLDSWGYALALDVAHKDT